ncbi:unnamed protein product [Fraxinus pennsylvanica]|uniref:peroxidase n=1 Tax=Fraxinus pennsylvanica TaxID=56036 RepID=A0AAD2ECR0_9LAMI|nr:unnamed protein product [Fraxinus pennsylvanica]
MASLTFYQFTLIQGQLKVGFHFLTCPIAETIVNSVVKEAIQSKPAFPLVLLRLNFHDCFVEGCDGSILIEKDPDPEKRANGHQRVDGFDHIQEAKDHLEAQCPGVVSCADIVTLAARDTIALGGGTVYEVETGRRDGRISNEKELVLLSAGRDDSDPKIKHAFLPVLKNQCPKNGNASDRILPDQVSIDKFDNQSLRNIKNGMVVLASDARLYDGNITKKIMESYAVSTGHNRAAALSFVKDFSTAMVKMGRIGVKIGTNGEIRANSFN